MTFTRLEFSLRKLLTLLSIDHSQQQTGKRREHSYYLSTDFSVLTPRFSSSNGSISLDYLILGETSQWKTQSLDDYNLKKRLLINKKKCLLAYLSTSLPSSWQGSKAAQDASEDIQIFSFAQYSSA